MQTPAMTRRGPHKPARRPRPAPTWRRTFLKDWRLHRDLTVEELAERAGLAASTISSIENHQAGYSAESLDKLAVALSVEPGWILSVNPNNDQDMLMLWQRATPADRARIAAVVRALIDPKG